MRQSTNGTWLYLSEDTLIYDKMVIKANQTLFQAEHIFSQSDGVNI